MAMHSDGELYSFARSGNQVFTEMAREEARAELARRESTARVHHEGAEDESRQADAIPESRVFVLAQGGRELVAAIPRACRQLRAAPLAADQRGRISAERAA